ncbi:polyprenyl synthetase family protein [Lacticaseibacillus jixianensis]|uniref:Polyprenyl synthetase family protein n=1 Tax=Lacticaseibacillus jixianensis TaxID=2486012 RepID=A0ABW4B7A7_9LACO|nr:polyprenyl synthetase family protein [Lacticaseibacillus jixianensis]
MVQMQWQQYPEVYHKLTLVQAKLASRTRLRVPVVNQRVQAQIAAGGKMLRSGLMFMLARFHSVDNPALISAGAAIEALHLATLAHDDVLDAAATRRGTATLNTTAGNKAAIYAGDFLFSVYFDLLAEAAPNVANVGLNARIMHRIFMGELDQNAVPRGTALTVHQYLRQISGKTAALFGLATYQGALLSQASAEQQAAAYRFGRCVGMAFQMIDDLLDVTGDPNRMQKPQLEDLKNGIYTLPTLFALRQDDGTLSALLADAAKDPERLHRAGVLIASAGVPEAERVAAAYTQKALASLAAFPAGPKRDELRHLTQALLRRTR